PPRSSPTATGPASRDELVELARALAPLIARNAAEGEQERRVVEESVRALADAGLLKLTVPRRYGGHETSLETLIDVCAEIGTADGGTAWVVTLLNAGAWMTSLFPERAQDEVFGADPDAKVSGVVTPTSTSVKVDGGYRVSGRWYWNSGSWHSDWAVLGIPFTDDEGAVVDHGIALVPRTELGFEETWFVAGMRSSGSNCLIAEDVVVPEHRTLSVSAAIEGTYPSEHLDSEPLYRSAFVSVLALTLVGPQLGLGRAALDLVRDKAATKPLSHTFFETQKDSTGFQLQLARAALMLDTAQLHARRAARDLDGAAARGEYPDHAARARVRADAGYVAEQVTAAIDILVSAHGAGTFAEANPLQRIWRDSATAARHAILNPMVAYEVYGKALVGSQEVVTPLV
ncbi:MAG: acyl-CoA dehydrogenase family protein, partial [Phycicoccus sp.]